MQSKLHIGILPPPSPPLGPTTVTSVDKIRFMSSGRAFEGAKLKIDSPDERGDGEVREEGGEGREGRREGRGGGREGVLICRD